MNTIVKDFAAILLTVLILSSLVALPTMWLWNTCLVPAVDSVNEVTFWQALGINILFNILFKTTAKQ